MNILLDRLACVPDFPVPGVLFRDISPLLADAGAFSEAIGQMEHLCRDVDFDHFAGIEARGFIFASALSFSMRKGMVLVRKPGKLPTKAVSESYGLEYGADRLEMAERILPQNSSVILVDDVLATGGTLTAASRLVQRLGSTVAGAVCLLEIESLGGKRRLEELGIRTATVLSV